MPAGDSTHLHSAQPVLAGLDGGEGRGRRERETGL